MSSDAHFFPQYGFYRVLPLSAPEVISVPQGDALPASIKATNAPCELIVGDYNVSQGQTKTMKASPTNACTQVENLSPRSHHISNVADHIVNYLNAPDIMFVQEIQSDSGSKNDGVVSANKTLEALVSAIAKVGKGIKYTFINIPPQDNQDGGKPGSNIRVAFL